MLRPSGGSDGAGPCCLPSGGQVDLGAVMSSVERQELVSEVRAWAELHELPADAPVDAAARVALLAFDAGESFVDARDRAAVYLRAWSAHPARRRGPATAAAVQ